jgi:hypothetical protein
MCTTHAACWYVQACDIVDRASLCLVQPGARQNKGQQPLKVLPWQCTVLGKIHVILARITCIHAHALTVKQYFPVFVGRATGVTLIHLSRGKATSEGYERSA